MKCKTAELVSVLKRLRPFLAPRSSICPASRNFFFDENEIYADDTYCGRSVQFSTGLKCAVPGVTLHDLLSNCNYEEVQLELEGNVLKLLASTSEKKNKLIGKFNTHEEYLSLPSASGEMVELTTEEAEMLFEALSLCSISCYKSIGSMLGGIAITEDGVLSSDNVRLSWHKGFNKIPLSGMLPYDSVVKLSQFSELPIGFRCDDRILELFFPSGKFYTVLVDFNFPVAKALPLFKDYDEKGFDLPQELGPALARAEALQADLPAERKNIELQITSEFIQVKAHSVFGSLEETIAGEFPVEAAVNVNPSFLAPALKKGLKIHYRDEEDPLCFSSGNFTHLVCVMRK